MSRASRVIVKESTGRRIIEQSHFRLLYVGCFFALCFFSISWRMIEVAVINNKHAATILVSDVDSEKSEQVEIKSSEPTLQRGDIVDRNGQLLATSLMTASVFANPKEISNPDEVAQKLTRSLGGDNKTWLAKIKSGKSFVWLKRNLTPTEQQAVNSMGVPGLYFLPEERRVYPYGNLFSHTVGYVGIDNKGLAGVEKQFDTRLRDGAKNSEPFILSVDVRLQAIMREEMKRAVEEFRAIGAMGVIMDVHSGELLSMVSLPDFDPHKPSKTDDVTRFNRATQGAYEMGSTFKTFTMAMGLDTGTVTMKGGYDATNPFKIATFTISDTHPKRRWLSVPEIYAYSSNIGTAKMALDVGSKKQKAFLEKMGMMKPVDIELPEKAYPLFPTDWKEINTVTISYGHGISVSPLHLVRGIAALASGKMPRLTVLKDGNKNKPEAEQVVSEDTSRNIRRLMRLVALHGTGTRADVAGYHVGGKTGTAEKVQSGGRYNEDAKLASFIATFPVDDPKYVMLVMVDEPKGNKSTYGYATGGWISAPVVGRVISRMGPLLGIKPVFDAPGDDADKFWVYDEKPKDKPVATQADKRYVHAVSY
ncbi:MAG: penicillin-binding protein 2 [Alphaproteobacteria bacterium]|nr:penicillin-binding protein 2 [Alphaproteobacteria bacterium]